MAVNSRNIAVNGVYNVLGLSQMKYCLPYHEAANFHLLEYTVRFSRDGLNKPLVVKLEWACVHA